MHEKKMPYGYTFGYTRYVERPKISIKTKMFYHSKCSKMP